jgi:hypothetical protein
MAHANGRERQDAECGAMIYAVSDSPALSGIRGGNRLYGVVVRTRQRVTPPEHPLDSFFAP